jgi:hypothetical protein
VRGRRTHAVGSAEIRGGLTSPSPSTSDYGQGHEKADLLRPCAIDYLLAFRVAIPSPRLRSLVYKNRTRRVVLGRLSKTAGAVAAHYSFMLDRQYQSAPHLSIWQLHQFMKSPE